MSKLPKGFKPFGKKGGKEKEPPASRPSPPSPPLPKGPVAFGMGFPKKGKKK